MDRMEEPGRIVGDRMGLFSLDTEPTSVDGAVGIALNLFDTVVYYCDQDSTPTMATPTTTPNDPRAHHTLLNAE
jgi:hypothetical protein